MTEKLNEADLRTPTWSKVKAWAADEIERARNKLEMTGENHDIERGRIKALRELIALEPTTPPIGVNATY